MKDTDSPVQYLEPRFCPLTGEPGSPQLTKASNIKKGIFKNISGVEKRNLILGDKNMTRS